MRVFGSVARGKSGPESDLDLLVELEPDRSLLDHAALIQELEELLGRKVDVVTENGTEPALAYVATSVNAARVPYIWYRSLVLAGALEQGLSAAYVDVIRAVTARTDPRPDRPTKREAEAALEGTGLPSE